MGRDYAQRRKRVEQVTTLRYTVQGIGIEQQGFSRRVGYDEALKSFPCDIVSTYAGPMATAL